LVIRAPKTDTTTTTATNASASSTTRTATNDTQSNRSNIAQMNAGGFPFDLGLTPEMGNLNFPNTNFLDMQQQLQQQVNLIEQKMNNNIYFSIDYE